VVTERKYPAYAWWAAIFTSAALLGCAITGLVPWWTVLIPWVIYGGLVLLLLVFVFLAAFIMTLVVGYIEYREEKDREKTYE
jgi:membrane protein YdbS with pleckstrin-like domain